MADNRSLGDRVRDARVKKDLTLRELAKMLDLALSYLSDIENDRRVLSEEVLRGLCGVLDLNFAELMAAA
jgi:transcriptional regulator with XRE-family HTH domain